MNASGLKLKLAAIDAKQPGIVCLILAQLRDYIAEESTRKGILGVLERFGVRRVLKLVDDYLADNCG